MGRLDPGAHPYFAGITSLEVSAHYLIRRDGTLIQYVDPDKRAWHAGVSSWEGRERCNDFSIGVELEGTDEGPFEPAQYSALASLIGTLRVHYPLRQLAAHSDIAPGRKTDPGPGFDPQALPDPCCGENVYSNHGRGIYLINQLMDEVQFHKNGTEIHMLKR